MKCIWKWTLDILDAQDIVVPTGAKFLDVQMQPTQTPDPDQCQLWAVVDDQAPRETRRIAVYGTGNKIPDHPGHYIATFQIYGGRLVFHAFDATPTCP